MFFFFARKKKIHMKKLINQILNVDKNCNPKIGKMMFWRRKKNNNNNKKCK